METAQPKFQNLNSYTKEDSIDVKIYSQSLTLIFCLVHDYVTVFGRKYASSQVLVDEMLRINWGKLGLSDLTIFCFAI